MKTHKLKRIKLNSLFVKFLPVFILFGGLLVLLTVSIQNDFAETSSEEIALAQEMRSLETLEKNLGGGEWSVRDKFLYKGDIPIGDGIYEHANIEPFLITEAEAQSFVYSFIDSSLADDAVIKDCTADGRERTAFLRVAGSTRGADGNPIVGTFLERSVAEELEKNDTFSGRSYVEGRLFYCYYTVIRDASGRRVGAVVAGHSIEEMLDTAKHSAFNSSVAIVVIILYTFFSLLVYVIKWSRSIKKMEAYLTEIGSGAFPEAPLMISGGDELGEMAQVINEMKLSLKEKERLRSELQVAKTIQAEMLPDADAAKELPESCRVVGFMTPAREVGGDLYDFFMIDENRLGLVIADVSDKGAPAALFMATSKMCIKDNMSLCGEPKDILMRVNDRLLENNKSGLFVTAWIGVLDLKTGLLKYAAAGHPFPLIKRADGNEYESLDSAKNLVLAGIPDFEYRQSETVLRPGDKVFLYTDGLDEARDKDGGFFGKQRILDYLNAHGADDIHTTVSGMKDTVDVFAAGREQFDDLTMLMFEYTGGHNDE